jgi:hypothetical protein
MNYNPFTAAREIITIIAIILGGCWAFWKWRFEENRRRVREISSLDGHLKVTATSLNEVNVLVTIEAIWRNPGVLPVSLNTNKAKLKIYEIDSNAKLGILELPKEKYIALPLKHLAKYILEPNTESTMQYHFTLEKEKVYFIRWDIYECQTNPDAKEYSWSRDLIWRQADSELSQNSELLKNQSKPT